MITTSMQEGASRKRWHDSSDDQEHDVSTKRSKLAGRDTVVIAIAATSSSSSSSSVVSHVALRTPDTIPMDGTDTGMHDDGHDDLTDLAHLTHLACSPADEDVARCLALTHSLEVASRVCRAADLRGENGEADQDGEDRGDGDPEVHALACTQEVPLATQTSAKHTSFMQVDVSPNPLLAIDPAEAWDPRAFDGDAEFDFSPMPFASAWSEGAAEEGALRM